MSKVLIATLAVALLNVGCASNSTVSIPFEPYTTADVEAKMACAVAVAKGEFYVQKLSAFGSPRVCQGVKASESPYWECVSKNLDITKNFATATGGCMSLLQKAQP